MTQLQLIEANFPVYFRCLCVPVEWRRAARERPPTITLSSPLTAKPPELDGDLLEVKRLYPDVTSVGDTKKTTEVLRATTFDPWTKRNEFFRLKQGDTEALLSFLQSVGIFERPGLGNKSRSVSKTLFSTQDGSFHDAPYESKISEKHIWGVRRLIEGSLNALSSHTGTHHDFQMGFHRAKDGKTRLVVTTATFLEALLLTLSVDQVQGARVRKCARPDCGVSFSSSDGHKRKYCEWYCGHIESVRRNRKQMRKRKGVERGKQR